MIPIYDLINGSQHPLRFLLQIRNLGTVWLSWVLCFGEAKTKVWQDHVPFWNFWTQICTQSHSACWSNSVPCNGTEVSISLLAVSVCVCGGVSLLLEAMCTLLMLSMHPSSSKSGPSPFSHSTSLQLLLPQPSTSSWRKFSAFKDSCN